jgi:hypothetical protein
MGVYYFFRVFRFERRGGGECGDYQSNNSDAVEFHRLADLFARKRKN